jgi:hypothetical protein
VNLKNIKGARHKSHILYDSTNMKCPEKQIHRDRLMISSVWRERVMRGNADEFLFENCAGIQ